MLFVELLSKKNNNKTVVRSYYEVFDSVYLPFNSLESQSDLHCRLKINNRFTALQNTWRNAVAFDTCLLHCTLEQII